MQKGQALTQVAPLGWGQADPGLSRAVREQGRPMLLKVSGVWRKKNKHINKNKSFFVSTPLTGQCDCLVVLPCFPVRLGFPAAWRPSLQEHISLGRACTCLGLCLPEPHLQRERKAQAGRKAASAMEEKQLQWHSSSEGFIRSCGMCQRDWGAASFWELSGEFRWNML